MMKRRVMLAMTMLACVSGLAQAQGGRGGRGNPPVRRDSVMSGQQRDAVQKLRQQQRQEMLDLRSKQRDQLQRALPPEARTRMAQRQRRLQREGRAFERMRRQGGGPAGRGRGSMMNQMDRMNQMQQCVGPRGGAGLRGGGGLRGGAGAPPLPPGGLRGRGQMAPLTGPGCGGNGANFGPGGGRGGMRGRGGDEPPPGINQGRRGPDGR